MKTLRLVCEDCGKRKVFEGKDADAILKAIDEARWRDMPGGRALCPKCDRKREQEYRR